MKFLEKNKSVARIKSLEEIHFREIYIHTTYMYSVGPCPVCKKERPLLAGFPTNFHVTIPLTDQQWEKVLNYRFWIACDFVFTCNNGYSHVITKRRIGDLDGNWVISTDSAMKEYVERGPHFEEVLARFIPHFLEMIDGGLIEQGFC